MKDSYRETKVSQCAKISTKNILNVNADCKSDSCIPSLQIL